MRLLPFAILLLLAISACAGRAPLTPTDLAPASAPLLAAEIFPDRPQDKHYDAAESGGRFILRTLTPTPNRGLDVRSLTYDAGDDPAVAAPFERRFLHLDRGADGAILLTTSAEGERTTLFEPPLVFMPPSLAPGDTFEASTDARVVNSKGREQASGHATRSVTYQGDQTPEAALQSTGQPGEALSTEPLRIVRATLELDLFPARVLTTTTYWIDTHGIRREQQTTNVWILGVPAQTRTHDVIFRGEPGGAP